MDMHIHAIPQHTAVRIVLALDAALFAFLTAILCWTAVKHRLIANEWTYLIAAAAGIVGCLGFASLAAGPLSGFRPIKPSALAFSWLILPSIVMAEAGFVGVLGSKGAWRALFLIPVVFGGTTLVRLVIRFLN